MLEVDSFQKVIIFNRLICAGLASAAIIGTLTPILAPKLPREIKLASLGIGVIASASFAVAISWIEEKEQIWKAILRAKKESLKNNMAYRMATDSAIQEMEASRALAYQQIAKLPPWEQGKWIAKFELGGILPQLQPSDPATQPHPPEPQPITAIAHTLNLGNSGLDEEAIAPLLEWLDSAAILASKAVVGAKGSGKSTALQYEAARFLLENPGAQLLIADIHFDPDRSQWLQGVPAEELEGKFVWCRAEQIIGLFRFIKSELLKRIEKRDRSGHQIKLICDEFVGFMARLDDKSKEEIIKIIQFVQFEGRKFNINITLGLHSAKKEVTGIGSDILANFDLWLLGRTIADPVTKWPADIDAKSLLQEMTALQTEIPPELGRLCVVKKLQDAPQVVLFPNVDLSRLAIQLD
jgi:hypothetical protein